MVDNATEPVGYLLVDDKHEPDGRDQLRTLP
jgi:hypothetical protein